MSDEPTWCRVGVFVAKAKVQNTPPRRRAVYETHYFIIAKTYQRDAIGLVPRTLEIAQTIRATLSYCHTQMARHGTQYYYFAGLFVTILRASVKVALKPSNTTFITQAEVKHVEQVTNKPRADELMS